MKRTLSPHRIASLIVSILLALITTVVQATIPSSERTVLVALYTSTNGASWTTRTNWNGAAGTECTWYGVTCNVGGTTVTGINLSSNNLTGTLPALTGLTSLQSFDVNTNQLTGTIPALTGLTNLLGFDVASNQLTGNVPSVPTPNALVASGSSLCPNALNRTPDPAWNTATGVTPWYTNCRPPPISPAILELLLL